MSVTVEDNCLLACKDLTQRGKLTLIIMKMDLNNLRVSLEQQFPAGTSHDTIVSTLHSITECRYVLFNFTYKTADGQDRGKSIHMLWAPSAAPLKQRTVYAAFNTHVRTKLDGISLELQASDVSEIQYADIEEKCNRKFR